MDESVLINVDDFDDLEPETSSPPPYYDNLNGSGNRDGSFEYLLRPPIIARYRWKSMMVASLILAIISSVGCLVVVVNLAVWLTHLGKMDKDGKNEDGSGVVRGLSVLLLLVAVAAGVCFILSATFVCHHWTGRSTQYHMLSRISKKRNPDPGDDPELIASLLQGPQEQMEMQTMQYHVCAQSRYPR